MGHLKHIFLLGLGILVGTTAFSQGGKGMRGGVPFTYASGLAPWTGANNQQILMTLIGSSQGRAIFQKEDGKIITTPLQSLSEESRKRVEECEQKMREGGYTQRGGMWYSADDLAALEKKAAETGSTGSGGASVTKVVPKAKMDCRVTSRKTKKNPGEFAPNGANWTLTLQGKPLTIPVEARNVGVTVQNYSQEEQTYSVYWYVVGRPFEFKKGKGHLGPRAVVEMHTETHTCKAQGFLRLAWESKEYPDSEDVKELSLQLIKAGRMMGRAPGEIADMAEFHAFVVQLVQDGKLIRSYSSTPKYSVAAEVFPFSVNTKP